MIRKIIKSAGQQDCNKKNAKVRGNVQQETLLTEYKRHLLVQKLYEKLELVVN